MKTGKIRKGLVIGIAAAALMASAAGAANVATDGQFFEDVRIFFVGDYTVNGDGSCTFTAVDENGNEMDVTVTVDEEALSGDVTVGGFTVDAGDRVKYSAEDGAGSEKSGEYTVRENPDGSMGVEFGETDEQLPDGTVSHATEVTLTDNTAE